MPSHVTRLYLTDHMRRGLVFGIVSTLLGRCGPLSSSISQAEGYRSVFISQTGEWALVLITDLLFYGVAWLIWVGIYLLKVVPALLRATHIDKRQFRLAQAGILGIVVLSWIPYFSVFEAWSYYGYDNYRFDGFHATKGAGGTYNVLCLLAILEGASICSWTILRLHHTGELGKVNRPSSHLACDTH